MKAAAAITGEVSRKGEAMQGNEKSALQSFVRISLLIGGLAVAQSSIAQQNTTTNYAYDAQGNLTQILDPRGKATNQSFDALDRLIQVQQPPATTGGIRPTISTNYDGRDEITMVTDPRGLATSFTVDGMGQVTQLQSPDTGTTQNTYDAAGNLTTSTDARGKVSTYSYDALNRVIAISYSSGTPTTYEYDGGTAPQANDVGRLTKVTDESGSTRLEYDAFGRVVKKTQTVAGLLRPLVTQYGYGSGTSATGKLITTTYPSGVIASYGYDASGRISQIALSLPTGTGSYSTSTLLSGVVYQPFGPPKDWTWGNGTAYVRTYDLDGRLITYPLGATTGSTTTPNALLRTLAYDPSSRVTGYSHVDADGSASSGVATAANQSFAYDDLDRLTNFLSSAGSQGYSYDITGNRTQLNIGSNSYPYTVDPASNHLISTAGPTPAKSNSYDGAGNLISDGTVTYGYSDRGRMAWSSQAANTVAYQYNGLGQRAIKSGPSTLVNSGAVGYAYDEGGHLLGEYTSNNLAIQETVYLGDTPVGVLFGAGDATDTGGGGGGGGGCTARACTNQLTYTNNSIHPCAPDADNCTNPPPPAPASYIGIAYAYADQIDTPRMLVRPDDNSMMWRWDGADPFGSAQPNADPGATGSSVAYNPRFPGQVFDQETGTHYNYFRNYDPSIGRYQQSDPIGLVSGPNTYAYVAGNPVSLADSAGLQFAIGAGAAAGSAAPAGALPGTQPRSRPNSDLDPFDPYGASSRASSPSFSLPSWLRPVSNGGDDDDCPPNCRKARQDAGSRYWDLTMKRIPQYQSSGTPDATHFSSILQKQQALKDAIRRVRLYCKPLPPEIEQWEEAANRPITPIH